MRALALLFLLVGCTGSNRDLQFNLGGDVIQLDWNHAIDTTSVTLLDNLMEGLTTYASSQGSADLIRPMPALAASWAVTEGGTLYRFHLRPGVYWTDGVPLEAQQFVDSWQRLLSPQTKTNSYHLFDIENAQAYAEGRIKDFSKVGVKAVDKLTLEVKLRRSVPYFLHLVSSVNTFPIRADLLGAQWAEPEHLVTLGPYKIVEWSHGSHILLERNPLYWGEKPTVARILCRLVTEPLTALALYENGQLDIIRDLPSSFAKQLQSHTDYRTAAKLSVSYLSFNTKRRPFDKAENRKAFIRGMDRAFFASFFQGAQTPTSSWIPPGMIGYRSAIGIAAEGMASKVFSGETVELRYAGSDTWNLVFQAMQKMMGENLGLRARLSHLDNREYRAFLGQLSAHGNEPLPHLFHLSWVADFPDPHSFMNVFTSTSESNYSGWANKKYDQLVETAVSLEDEEARTKLYLEAQKLLLEDEAVVMPIFFTSHQALVKPDIRGVNLNVLDKWYFKNIRFEDSGKLGRSWLKKIQRNT